VEFLTWLEATAVAQFVASDPYAYPTLLCMHALGMGTVVGIVWMLDLRVLGFPKSLPLSTFRPLTNVAWAGFGLNALSGILLFTGAATRTIVNTNFQLKLLLIALGGFSVWLIHRSISEAQWEDGEAAFSARAKVIAFLSILFWLGATVAGRYIAYTLAAPSL
jgi:hypothetical protein